MVIIIYFFWYQPHHCNIRVTKLLPILQWSTETVSGKTFGDSYAAVKRLILKELDYNNDHGSCKKLEMVNS